MSLTPEEHDALRLTKELANQVILKVMKPGTEFEADHRMFVTYIHAIQHMIMAQSAAREYPEQYRLMGQGWGDDR